MILKLLSYEGIIKLDAPNPFELANQLKIPKNKIKTETISFECTDASVHLFLLGELNLVLFYGLYESPDSVVYVTTSREEAFKVFREQTLLGCINEYSNEEEEKRVEKILEKYGLLEDLKVVFEVIKKLGGSTNLDEVTNFVKYKGLNLGCGYPSVVMSVRLTDEEMQRDYLETLALILEERGYLEITNEEGGQLWRIVKQIDF